MNDMNKTERNKIIKVQVYKMAEKLGYNIDFTDNDVVFMAPSFNNDDDIEYRRSSHTLAALNWASAETHSNVLLIEKYIDELKSMSDEALLVEYQGA
jgi:hypothetical protein